MPQNSVSTYFHKSPVEQEQVKKICTPRKRLLQQLY